MDYGSQYNCPQRSQTTKYDYRPHRLHNILYWINTPLFTTRNSTTGCTATTRPGSRVRVTEYIRFVGASTTDEISYTAKLPICGTCANKPQKRVQQRLTRAFLIAVRAVGRGSARKPGRMGGGVDLLQFADGDVGVALGGGQRGVAEHGLDEEDVGAVVEHVGGAGMAEQMARSGLVDARDLHHPADARGQKNPA